MRSMTGYGRGEALLYDRRFIVEIKSVNQRYNDINIKMPRTLIMYEDRVRKLLAEDIFRGKTDVFINFESYSQDDVQVKVNEILAEGYMNALNSIKSKYGIEDNVSLGLISRFPDIITVEKNTAENEGDKIWECLKTAASEALKSFVAMRETEGEALKNNILEKLDIIDNAVKKVEKRAPMVAADYRQRLTDRLAEIEELKNIDETRLITEVALFADKACIDEEITRMFSHIAQMRSILAESVPVGRKLDFLVQEMNREVNTIGSKSNDLEITNTIVDTKSEIEKIREQIQNLE